LDAKGPGEIKAFWYHTSCWCRNIKSWTCNM
jgi:hypothetical protein